MMNFVVVELEDGLTIVELRPGQTAQEAAVAAGGILVDPEPYPSYEDAYDALLQLEGEEEEEETY